MVSTVLKKLDDRMLVAGQIAPDDMAHLPALGVTAVINNRPDGEEPGQPVAAEMEQAARAAGVAYAHIPVAGGFSAEQVEAMGRAMAGTDGKVLAFCRSGTRSTYLWALAQAQAGVDPDVLMAQAAEAGCDLSPVRGAMISLGERG